MINFKKINEICTTECDSCGRLYYKESLTSKKRDKLDLEIFEKLTTTSNQFNKELNEFLNKKELLLCKTCLKSLKSTYKKRKIPVYSKFNKLYPCDIPEELNALSEMELSIISRIKPYMKIISLKGE